MATRLDMAEQQLFGWSSREHGETLIGLVRGMGLTYKEWKRLKESGAVDYITEQEAAEIECYMSTLPQ